MTTFLLIIIYIAFIGLGIPDSLFGAAWPAIYPEFGIPISLATLVTVIISSGTIFSSLFAARLINRFGTGKITAVSTTATALALLGFSFSGSILHMCLLAVPLGLGAGAIDTALNNYVALHYKASHMSFLHCFYGIGVSLSPFLMSLALAGGSWRSGYRTVFWFQLGIALLTLFTLPVWKIVRHGLSDEAEEEQSITLGFLEMLKIPKVVFGCLTFIGSCAIEYTCGVWGSTFLVNSRNLSAEDAARCITFYYAGIALGRFFSGILSNRFSAVKIIKIGQIVTLTAIATVFLTGNYLIAGTALFFIGLGNGPVFPNLIHMIPINFGREISQSITGIQMASSYVGIMLAPAVFGLTAQAIGTSFFPLFLILMYAIMLTGSILANRKSNTTA